MLSKILPKQFQLMKMKKYKEKDPLKPKEDVRIDKKDGDGFLDTLSKVVGVNNDDICPKHGLKSRYIPPSTLDGTTLYATYECPKGTSLPYNLQH